MCLLAHGTMSQELGQLSDIADIHHETLREHVKRYRDSLCEVARLLPFQVLHTQLPQYASLLLRLHKLSLRAQADHTGSGSAAVDEAAIECITAA